MTLQVNKERIKAIVIDDDEDSSDSICQALEISGINVVGKGFDGAYALEKIKQDYPDAKIVVVTGFTNYMFEKEQADAIFTKPYDLEPFIDTVNKIALATPTIVK